MQRQWLSDPEAQICLSNTRETKKMIKFLLEKIYHYSSALNVWSWQKLYGNKRTGLGYKKIETSDYNFPSWIKGYKKWKKK